jgi:glycosyltransferase involved in cell wall biosynthesis
MMKNKKKLLLIGGLSGNAHLRNYYYLIKDYFDEIIVVSNNEVDFCTYYKLDFGLKNPLKVLKSIKELKRIIQEFNPSIIHVHQANSYAYITSLANKGKYPQMLTTWGSDVLLLPKMGAKYRYIVKKSLKSSQIITADASYMGEAIKNLIGNVPVTIANFGIEIPGIAEEPVLKEKIIYSNRLHKKLYNIEQIIDGLAIFLSENRDWKLIIGASGDQTDTLKLKAAAVLPINSYEFIGFVTPEINKSYYLKSSLYISIPMSDGTSISLLEAMTYGCIPIVSNLPANKEWINNNQNGVVVGNHETLTDAVDRAMLLSQSEVAKFNTTIIQNKGSKEANKKVFEDLYDQLLLKVK